MCENHIKESRYKSIEIILNDGKHYSINLNKNKIRIIDKELTVQKGVTKYAKEYRFDGSAFFNGYMIDLNESFCYLLSSCKNLDDVFKLIEQKFAII